MKPFSLLASFLFSAPAFAQGTIHVPGDAPTIQAGIELAQPGDTVLVAPGTYNEVINFLGKAITVRSEAGAASTIIDATGSIFPCVSFHQGETSSSVLQGFTVTKARNAFFGLLGGGISCLDTSINLIGSPTIRKCAIVSNSTQNSPGGGVFGNPTLEDCTIAGNSTLFNQNSGGGVFGVPIIRRCVISGNSGYDGGGVYVSGAGALIEDSLIQQNIADEGTRGAGVYFGSGQGTLRGCLIVRNRSIGSVMFQSQGAGVHVFSAGAPPLIERCTIVYNEIENPGVYGNDNTGGVHGDAQLVDCIAWGNEQNQVSTEVIGTFSDVEGGLSGVGNIDADPLFVDPANLDYHLLAGSPCIDTGDPLSSLDPDCTRADMGAFHFPQANIVFRNGMGINRACLQSLNRPVVGGTWMVRIAAAGHPGAMVSGMLGVDAPLVPGVVIAYGELLIDLNGTKLLRASQASNGVADDFAFAIPPDPALVGLVGYVQGFVAGNGVEFCNALDVKLGN